MYLISSKKKVNWENLRVPIEQNHKIAQKAAQRGITFSTKS